jgi:outer membrane protein assembly factor BamD
MKARRYGTNTIAWGAPRVAGLLLVVLLSACASTSPFTGMDADELYEAGMAAFEEERWDDAADALERLVSGYPGYDRNAEARFHLGQAYFGKEQYLTAANEFGLFLGLHHSHGLAPEASLGICRSYARLAPHPERDQEHTRRARDACRQTRDEFPGTNVAEEAEGLRAQMVEILAERLHREGRFYQRRGAHDSAILVFQDLVDYYPETSWAPRGFLGLYNSYREIGWDEEADEARSRLLFLYPDSEEAAELRAETDGNNGRGGSAYSR